METKRNMDQKANDKIKHESQNEKALLGNNFLLMGISAILIILGFVLMAGSSSGLDEFNPDIFSTRRIVIGPAISFIGFALMGVAIIIKPKNK